MAGEMSLGHVRHASTVVVSMSSAMPCASLAMTLAVAGAIMTASAFWTTATVLGLFQLLCADSGFIKFLKTWALYCGAGDESTGFYCRIADHDPTTGAPLAKPLFIVKYNGNTVFQIDPASGNVFMGRPNVDLNAPETGFMYRASDGVIISKNSKVSIDDDGALTVSEGNFTGAINATSGSFAGKLDGASGIFSGSFITPSLESRPVEGVSIKSVTLSNDATSQITSLLSLGLSNWTLYPCTFSSDSNIKYVEYTYRYAYHIELWAFDFYDKNGSKLYEVYKQRTDDTNQLTYKSTLGSGTLNVGPNGDILIFKNIPLTSSGLVSGQIYRDSNNQLYIVP